MNEGERPSSPADFAAFLARLRALREQTGQRDEDLARAIEAQGITRAETVVARIVAGRSFPSRAVVALIDQAVGANGVLLRLHAAAAMGWAEQGWEVEPAIPPNLPMWRALAAQMYRANGSPPLSGFSARRIQQILAGEDPPDASFTQAMLSACEKAIHEANKQSGLSAQQNPHMAETFRRLVTMKPRQSTETQPMCNPSTARVSLADDANDVVGAAATGRLEALGYAVGVIATAPFPGDATTAVQLTAGLRILKEWTGLSLRQLEDNAKRNGDILPRSTIYDILRRRTIPKQEALYALTGAFGLPESDRDRWESLRRKVELAASNTREDQYPTAVLETRSEVVGTPVNGPETRQTRWRTSWRRKLGAAKSWDVPYIQATVSTQDPGGAL